MKKQSNPISLMLMIAVIGVIISILSGSEVSQYFKDLEISSLEVLLDYLNIGLAFLALAGVFIFLIVRAARKGEEYYGEFEEVEKKDEGL